MQLICSKLTVLLTSVLLASHLAGGGVVYEGQATYYADGVFERVWAYRRTEIPACAECLGFAAMLEPGHIGRRVWVSNGREWVGPLLVIDAAASQHRDMLVRRGWVIDLPYWLAQRWEMRGPIDVVVRFDPPCRWMGPPGCAGVGPC